MATFTGQAAQDNVFVGTAFADSFLFNVADLDSGDTLTGNAGVDTVVLSGTGVLTAARLTGLSSIEAFTLANGGIGLTLSDAIATALGGLVTVNGSAGDDLVDYSAVTLANRPLTVFAGSGNDILRGGAGNDAFRFAINELTAADSVSGGGGSIDQLVFESAGTITAANMAGVSGIERVVLANGTNSVTFNAANAAGAQNGVIQVVTGTGNDTINGTALTAAALEVYASGGLDTIYGTSGGDTVRIGGADLAGDTINGFSGYDNIIVTSADALSVADLAGLANIEQLTLNAAGTSVTINNAIASANAGVLTIYGSSGNDVVDGSSVTLATRSLTVTGLGGDDVFRGGAGFDVFRFNVADLTAGDTVSGGDGVSVDAINFMTAGTIAAGALANVSGIERLTFVAGTNGVTLTDAFVASATGQRVTVYGNSGNDTIDAATLTGTNRIEVYAGLGNDVLRGGAGNDLFRFSVAGLDAGDTVAGGAGYDELAISSGGQLTAARLANVSGIEQITFATGGLAVTLDNATAAANAAVLAMFGSVGNDTVDASAVTDTTRGINAIAGAGNDSFRGGLGADTFRFNAAELTAADVVSGGGGSAIDALQITAAGTVAASALAQVRGIEAVSLNVGGVSFAVSDAFVASANGRAVTIYGSSGNDVVDASALADGANRVDVSLGTGDDSITGGAGNDTFRVSAANLTSGDTLAGGAGSDTLLLNGAGTTSLGGNITGIETLALGVGGITAVLGAAFGTANGASLAVTGSAGNDVVDGAALLGGTALTINAGAGNDTVRGGAGADVFNFAATDLNGSDVVSGGDGASVDTLRLTTAGTLTAAALAGVSGIEAFLLANGTNSLALSSTQAGSAYGGTVTVTGGTGADSLNTSAVTVATQRVEFSAGTGSDAYVGGTGIDVLKIAAAELTAADSFAGGSGSAVDVVEFTTAGTVGATSGVTGVERFQLNAGGNSLAVGDATVASATSATLTVLGGAGNDVVNASAVANAANKIDVTSGAGNDSLVGGAGNDIFRFAPADLTGADTVNGGAGSDTLLFTAAGSIAAAQLAGTSNIEQVTLGGSGSSIAFDNAALANNAAALVVASTGGNDVIDASAVTTANRAITVTSGAGNDTLRGGAGADSFQFTVANLTGADVVQGGAGSAIDTLQFTTIGSITTAMLAGVSGIERVLLANGTNSIVLGAAFAASADAQTLRVIGGSGNDTINGAAATTRLDIAAGSGDDLLIGGSGADIFRVNIGALTAADNISGGDGQDALVLNGAGTIDFTNGGYDDSSGNSLQVAGIDVLQLDNSGQQVVIGDNLVQGADAQSLTVRGGTGADTIDVKYVSNSNSAVAVDLGEGDDAIIAVDRWIGQYGPGNLSGTLGAGNDRVFAYYGYVGNWTLDGGSGTDTLDLDLGSSYGYGATMGAGVTGFEVVNLVDPYNGSGYFTGFTANDTAGLIVNGAASSYSYNIKLGNGGQTVNGNSAGDSLVGGTGADTIHGAAGEDRIDGFGGADVVDAGDDNDAVRYRASALSITGGAGIDTLYALEGGVFDLSAADQSLGDTVTVTGFENFDGYSFYSGAWTDYNTAGATVTGSSGANVISGSEYADVFDGNGGADTIVGRSGADRITYRGTEAALHAYYEGGYYNVGQGDTLVLRAAATVRLADLDQTAGDGVNVTAFQNVDGSAITTALSLTGDSYDNVLTGGSGADTIGGGEGGDTIDGGTGADRLTGGAGNDRIWYDAADTLIQAGTDIDTLLMRTGGNINLSAGDQGVGDSGTMTGFEHVDASASTAAVTLRGSNVERSTLIGSSAADTIVAGTTGSDITGGAGADTLTGSTNNDAFFFNAGDVVSGEAINGGAGSDTAYVRGDTDFSVATLTGIERLEIETSYVARPVTVTLSGTQAAAMGQIQGNYGDYVYGTDTADTFNINVASGTTISLANISWAYLTASDRVNVNGAAGNETITGPNVAATIHGFAGNDTLKAPGTAGSAYWAEGMQVYGDAGNDRIDYGYADYAVTLDGGADTDTLVGTYNGPVPTVDLALADQTLGDRVVVSNFENVDYSAIASGYALTAFGNAGVNSLIGTAYADTLDGRAGADVLIAGAGNDTVVYDAADTSIQGGADIDRLIVNGAANINLAAADQGLGDTGTMTGFEIVDASASAASVTLRGRNDYVSTLIGGAAADTIVAGTGGAVITGGAGADSLTGSANNDTFFYRAGDVVAGEVLNAGGGTDVAYVSGSIDFSVSTITGLETLDIETYDPATGSYGTQPVNIKLTGAQAAALSAFYFDGGNGAANSLTIAVASGSTVDLGNTSYNSVGAQDQVLVNGAAGNETITGPSAIATVHGNAGNDILRGAQGLWAQGSMIYGDAGNDRIDYGYSAHEVTLDGGADSDTLVGSYANYYTTIGINLGLADQTTGDNAIVSNFENVDWSALSYGIAVIGSSGVNLLTGGGGNDWFDGREGADTIDAGSGDDTVIYDAADAVIRGGDGTDWLNLKGAANINLAAADQGVGDAGTMTGFENVNAAGANAAVTIRGSDSVQSILIGGSAGDTITAGASWAEITGGTGADTLTGGINNDTFHLHAGEFAAGEAINGGDGYDRLLVTGSTDFTIGSLANVETLELSRRYDPVTETYSEPLFSITLTGAQAAGLGSITSYYEPAEQTTQLFTINVASGTTVDLGQTSWNYLSSWDQVAVNGAAGNETIVGPNVRSTVHGYGGNDTLRAPTGGYWAEGTAVYGDAGDDRIDYGYQSYAVTLDGGADTDTLVASYDYYDGSVSIDLSLADQTVGDAVTASNFENVDWSAVHGTVALSGSDGVNRIVGSRSSNLIDGRGGADVIDGGEGDDTIVYDATDTLVQGGEGVDWLVVRGAANIDLRAADQGLGDAGTMTGFEHVDARGSVAAVTLRGSDLTASKLLGGSGADTITFGTAGGEIIGGGGADILTGTAAAEWFTLYEGDFQAGETIDGNGGGDTLWVSGTVDLSVGSVTGISALSLFSGSYTIENGVYVFTNAPASASVTLTGAQASSFSQIQANSTFTDTSETVTIRLAAGVDTNLSGVALNYFQAGDTFNVTGSSGNDLYTHVQPNGAVATVHGNGGNDVLAGEWAGGSVYGDAGDDRIDYAAGSTIDGGTGTDTLVLSGYDYGLVDLGSAADQTSGDDATVTGFENIDASGLYYAGTFVGDAGANVIIGTSGADTLTGGAGADTFGFNFLNGNTDTITDFVSADDTLSFARELFDFNGLAFDTVVNDTTGSASLATADLVRYTGGQLNSTADVNAYLQANGSGIADGAFILGQDSNGHTLLFHTAAANGYNSGAVLVADLGTVSLASIQTSDFLFF
ncbi:calcium-binding protein [Sphingomonas jatrophae]|uniref:Hemolysin-type calcium-binding repeat-containing protein n=1 Tax=Sphingomonas jatrophae TaxID=1166337 RepID=A0A1I6M5I4_9SPHN|nr:calcium-binding protein [Sphingomonas jatrophae]SFS10949.1 Hemolysin-type calcium-binding repeat-containing protein [Sphingomonas jatrophae]